MIKDVWFNGIRHLLPKDLLGPQHSEALADIIEKKQLPWNSAFQGCAVCFNANKPIELTGGLTITVLSPTRKELFALSKLCIKGSPGFCSSAPLDRLGRKDGWPPPAFSTLVARPTLPDKSTSNASSIALLLTCEKKNILLAGDASAEVLSESIDHLRLAKRVKVDLLKVSHHGSQGNTTAEFLRKLECNRFAFSTNGNIHGHPDEVAIARVIAGSTNPELIFNYATSLTIKWKNPPLGWPRYSTTYPQKGEIFVRVTV